MFNLYGNAATDRVRWVSAGLAMLIRNLRALSSMTGCRARRTPTHFRRNLSGIVTRVRGECGQRLSYEIIVQSSDFLER